MIAVAAPAEHLWRMLLRVQPAARGLPRGRVRRRSREEDHAARGRLRGYVKSHVWMHDVSLCLLSPKEYRLPTIVLADQIRTKHVHNFKNSLCCNIDAEIPS